MLRAVPLFLAAVLLAGGSRLDASPEEAPLRWSWRGELAVIDYEEKGVMSEDGLLYGLAGSVESDIDQNWMWRLEGSWVYGRLDYEGAVVNLVTGEEVPAEVETPNTILNARLLAARRVDYDGRTFRPYTGLGYRLLIDDLPGDAGYTREQTYWYVPIGVEAGAWSPSQWQTGLRIEFDWLIRGFNDSETDVGFVDASVSQDSGYGIQFSLTLQRVLQGISRPGGAPLLTIEPFVQYWDIDRSDSDTDEIAVAVDGGVLSGTVTYVEPANTTEIFGIRAHIEF